jgi:hypothetical protein
MQMPKIKQLKCKIAGFENEKQLENHKNYYLRYLQKMPVLN